MSGSPLAFWCQHRDGYSVISFPAELSTAHMAEVRDAGLQIIDQLSSVKSPACLVDLTALDYMGSSLVASIVRIWKAVKAQDGRMVVVASNERIVDVLKATGLTKVWTIVDTFESGVHALGFSPEARLEKRERRLLTFAGPLALVGGCLAVAVRIVPRMQSLGTPPDWMIYTLCGLSCLASGISLFRERRWRLVLCVFGLLLGVLLTGFYVWYAEIRVPPVAEPPSGGVVIVPEPDEPESTEEGEDSNQAMPSTETEEGGAAADAPDDPSGTKPGEDVPDEAQKSETDAAAATDSASPPQEDAPATAPKSELR